MAARKGLGLGLLDKMGILDSLGVCMDGEGGFGNADGENGLSEGEDGLKKADGELSDGDGEGGGDSDSGVCRQRGGYEDNRPGEASGYYAEGQQQYNGHPAPHHGQGYDNRSSYETQQGFESSEGERGLMGGVPGGAVGAFGGHKVGGMTGHSKMSTIAGAVAGAIAGHKLQDGVEDWKDDRDEKKKEEKRRREKEERRKHEQQQQQHHSPSHRDEGPRRSNYAGNFTGSCRDIRLEARGDYNLHESYQRADGSYQASTISLNRIPENDNGSFHWARANASANPSGVTVQPGDTLHAIAARHNCDFHDMARQNGMQNEDMIYPGQILSVPGGGSGGGGAGFAAEARDVRLVDGGQRLEGELRREGRWVLSPINLDERIGNRDGCLELV
ncbi:carbohydrate-binding module family 50 protein [Lentithecium fluviatile CBS 122367]|uniref:Carbohydrate-binding module family 50 protein n=1 Tax=Lentithecium fluviatile CBS 122367 TaxID=1168545 RepID=A0A6G1IKM2_9PLEO|nr:carbohydrate-binding module family 50 protein [Lentithecium fluviatile CBS 122367]